jgi:hypothetical protein
VLDRVDAALQNAEAEAAARTQALERALPVLEQDRPESPAQLNLQGLEKPPPGWQAGSESMAQRAGEVEAALSAAETALRQWLTRAGEVKRGLADCTSRAV